MEELNTKIKELHQASQKTEGVSAIYIAVQEGRDDRLTSAVVGRKQSIEALICCLIQIVADQGHTTVNDVLMDIVGAVTEEK